MSKWRAYRKMGLQQMRRYVVGEDLGGVSVNAEDTPGPGGMIARNATNHADQWYVAEEFFRRNYAPEDAAARILWLDGPPHFVWDAAEGREITKGDYCEARECAGCADGDIPCEEWRDWWQRTLAEHGVKGGAV